MLQTAINKDDFRSSLSFSVNVAINRFLEEADLLSVCREVVERNKVVFFQVSLKIRQIHSKIQFRLQSNQESCHAHWVFLETMSLLNHKISSYCHDSSKEKSVIYNSVLCKIQFFGTAFYYIIYFYIIL